MNRFSLKKKDEEEKNRFSVIKKVAKTVLPIITPRTNRIVNTVSKVLKSEPVQKKLAEEKAISRLPIKEQAAVKFKQTGRTMRDIVGAVLGGASYLGKSAMDLASPEARKALETPQVKATEKKLFGKLAPRNETVQEFVKKDVIPFSEKYNLPKGATVPIAVIGSIFFENPGNPLKGLLKPVAKDALKVITKQYLEEGEEVAMRELKKLIPEEQHGLAEEAISNMRALKENNALDEDYLVKYVEENVPPVKKTGEIQQSSQLPEGESRLPPIDRSPGQEIVSSSDSVPPIKRDVNEIDADERNIIDAIRDAQPIRNKQETIYSAERRRRLGKAMGTGEKVKGEKGFYAQLGALKGELPKVDYESIRPKMNQETIDRLFERVKNSSRFYGYDKINAQTALSKLLSPIGGSVPTRSELKLLEKEFSAEFVDTLLSKRPLMSKFKEAAAQIINIPRSIMSGFLDFSFGGRQGIFAAPRYRKEFWNSWKQQFKIFGSEEMYKASREALENNPNFKLAEDSGVSFTDVGRDISEREERFASAWAEKIPVLGKGIRATGRAYTAFANKYRMDIFNSILTDFKNSGIDVKDNVDLLQSLATFVNSATGRGPLPQGLEQASNILNAVFFSPRLMASRLTLLNPMYYYNAPAPVRKEALKTLATFVGTITTVLTAVSVIPGVTVGTDPRSSDFAKIKTGNTRIDIAGGFQQYVRMAAQLISGKYISSVTGKEFTLGEGHKPLTRYDILLRQIESKEAPVVSFFSDMLKQQDYAGNPFNTKKEIIERLTPMIVGDSMEIIKEDPALAPLVLLGIFGFSLQTYSQMDDVGNTPKKKSGGSGGNRFNISK